MQKCFKVVGGVLSLLLLAMPMVALCDNSRGFLDNDLNYGFESGSSTHVCVSGLKNSSATHITIPSTVVYEYTDYNDKDDDDNYKIKHRICSVTSIGYIAFMNCSGLTSVTIPNSVTSIGEYAFSGCSGLTSVTISTNVTWIGNGTFSGCRGLASVTIPNSVTSIGDNVFSYCDGLTSVTIPNSVTSIGQAAFMNCDGLTSVTIPDSVTSIGDVAFSYCDGLTNVTIGNGVTSIGFQAFDSCSSLTNVTIGNGVTSIGMYAFRCCRGLTSVTIPNSVTRIEGRSFYGCSGLTSVTIPDSVTYVALSNRREYGAFEDCGGLTSVTIPQYVCSLALPSVFPSAYNRITNVVFSGSITNIGASAFAGFRSLTSVTIPNSVTSIGQAAFMNCSGLTSVTIPDGVTCIGTETFDGCTNLTSVTIPDSVTNIGDYAFRDCSRLASVTIPDSVTSIGRDAFKSCSGLTSVTIPNSVTRIGGDAFYNCSGLTSVTIGNGVTNIEYDAFYGCSGLTSVTIPNSVTSIGSSAFSGCSGLTSVTIGNGVTSIGGYAFSGCSGLTSVTIPSSVTSIGGYAFSGCSGLTGELTIPDSVTSIGEYAFKSCRGLTSVTIGNGVTNIVESAFSDCSGLTSVTIPDSVTSIGKDSFKSCRGLTSVTIPDSVTSIGGEAFYNCRGLTSVTIGNGVTSIEYYAFYGCSGLTSVTIPNSVTSIGDCAFHNCRGLTSVTIPDSVTRIGHSAFLGCSGLKSVYVSHGDGDRIKGLMIGSGFNVSGVSFIEHSVALQIVFDANGGSGIMAAQTFTNGVEQVLAANQFTYDGHTFDGWATSAGGSAVYADGQSIAVSSDMTLYAHWTATQQPDPEPQPEPQPEPEPLPEPIVTCAVTFDANGGELPLDDTVWIVLSGTALGDVGDLPLPTHSANYEFIGWFAAKEGGDSVDGDTLVTADMTLYAHWQGIGGGDEPDPELDPPANDNFEDAEELEGESGSVNGWNVGATVEEGEFHDGSTTATVWYAWTAATTETVMFGVRAEYDSTLGVYTGGSVSSLTCVAFNDDCGKGGYSSAVAFDAVEGQTYYVVVGGYCEDGAYEYEEYYEDSTGLFELVWEPYEYDVEFKIDENGVLTDFGYDGFVKPSVITIPEGVVAIAESTFEERYGIVAVNLPSTLKSIGAYAFAWCDDLRTVNGLTDTIDVGRKAFYRTPFDATRPFGLDIVANCVAGYHGGPCPATLTIPDGVTNVAEEAFNYGAAVTGIQSVVFSATVGSIGEWAFEDCKNIVSVDVGNPEILIDGSAFSGCENLATIAVEKTGYTLVGWDLFRERNPGWWYWDDETGEEVYEEWEADFIPTGTVVRIESIEPLVYGMPTGAIATNWLWNAETEDWDIPEPYIVRSHLSGVWATPAWEVNQYTLSFNANGGSEVAPITQDYGTEVIAPAAPTREGYTFASWTPALPETMPAEDATLTAQWTVNKYTVTFDANGGEGGWSRNLDFGSAISAPVVTCAGYTFVGWSPAVTATVPASDIVFVAQWEKDIPELHDDDGAIESPAPTSAASEYNGYLVDKGGVFAGTIQVKLGKPNKAGLAAASATVQIGAGKKKTFKATDKGKVEIAKDGPTQIVFAGAENFIVFVGYEGMSGSYGAYDIDGSRNLLASKDKSEANAAGKEIAKWVGALAVRWNGGNASVTIDKKGKAKVSIVLSNGTKGTATTSLLMGDEWHCIPVMVTKKMNISFTLWLSADGSEALVSGLGDDVIVGKTGNLKSGAKFHVDVEDGLWAKVSPDLLTEHLPNEVPVAQKGTKFTLPKAGKLTMKKGVLDTSKAGDNPSGLKLALKKDGTFTGSFKVYYIASGKLKTVTVNVSGIVINGTGSGTATIKNVGSIPITIK